MHIHLRLSALALCAASLSVINASAQAPAPLPTAPFTEQQVCAAGIASMMGRDPKTVKIAPAAGHVYHVSYVRPDDGKRWTYRCMLQGSRVMWASESGRWRDDPRDEVLTYSVSKSRLTIVETAGEEKIREKAFTQAQLPKN